MRAGSAVCVSVAMALFLGIGALLVGSPTIATAATTQDQVQTVVDEMFCVQPAEGSACYHGAAQTITAGSDGDLIAVSLVVHREAFTTHELAVQIRSGGPGGAVLATSVPVAPSGIPTSPDRDWVMFTFAAPATFQAGDVYAIVLPDIPISATPDPRWALGKAAADVYPGGVAFGGTSGTDWGEYQDGSDFAFKTYVVNGAPTCDLAVSASGGHPVNELTVGVGDEVDLIGSDFGVFAHVTLEVTSSSADPVQDGVDTDVFGGFVRTLVFEPGDIGQRRVSATSDETGECADTVGLTVVAAPKSPPSPHATVPPTSTDMTSRPENPSGLWALITTVIAATVVSALAARRAGSRAD